MTLVIVPLMREASETDELAGRLAGFLRDLTGDLPAVRVHEAIADHCAIAEHDPRVDGALADSQEFAAIWNRLIAGLPAWTGAWERVVLPAVVAFSDATSVKAHLELATSYWVADAAKAGPPVDATLVPLAPAPVEKASVTVAQLPREPAAHKRRGWLWILVVFLVIALLVLATLWSQYGDRPASNIPSTLDRFLIASAQASPPAADASPAVAMAMPPQEGATLSMPTPTWNGSGPNLTVKPGTTLLLGTSFTVSGAGWTCASKAKVEVLLSGQPIVRKDTTESGAFSAAIDVHTDHESAPFVKVLDGGGELTLTPGTFDLLVRLVPGQAQCPTDLSQTLQITFSDSER